jgi:dihydrodipicolinate synthase/N-acetylneuraminate lyase
MRFRREKPVPPKPASRVFAALITPRRAGANEADLAALFDLLDFVASRGVAGIALYGSTGEFVHYSLDERARVAGLCVKRSRVPVLVNVSHSTFEGTVFMAQAAADAGAAGMLIMPPYYYRYDQEEIEAYFMAVGGAMAKLGPLYLYNIPVFSSPILASTAVRLLQTGMFAGIKDSSGDPGAFETLAHARATHQFELFAGNDRIYRQALRAGAAGIISGVACALPELLLAMDAAAIVTDDAKVEALNAQLQEFIDRIEPLPAPVGIREAAGARGLKPGPHAAPLGETALKHLFDFRQWFTAWLPGVLEDCR